MSKIEDVARVLEPQAWAAKGGLDSLAYQNRRTSSLRKARAAIEAMRTPTEAMENAGDNHAMSCAKVWVAMIEAALKEQTK